MIFNWFATPLSSPILIAAIGLYLFAVAASTVSVRVEQCQRRHLLNPSRLYLPRWTDGSIFLEWLLLITLILMNPWAAGAFWVIKGFLRMLPVMENIGLIFFIPIVGSDTVEEIRKGLLAYLNNPSAPIKD